MSNKKSYVIYNTITEQYLARNLVGYDDDVLILLDGTGISWIDEVLNENWIIQFSEELISDQNALAHKLIKLGIINVAGNLEFIQVDNDGVNFVEEKIRIVDILVRDKDSTATKKSYEYTLEE